MYHNPLQKETTTPVSRAQRSAPEVGWRISGPSYGVGICTIGRLKVWMPG